MKPKFSFWKNRRVFITGDSGFKGAWLALWLQHLGAKVHGYSLTPPTKPSLCELARIHEEMSAVTADVRDLDTLKREIIKFSPEIVFHLAAQSLVRESYANPLDTYSTNVMGTLNLLEGVRNCPDVRAVVIVTSDKCYSNMNWAWGYRETDSLGGNDPYSNSKGCAELVAAAFRHSFFNKKNGKHHAAAIATARAGNVIGGGDWAKDRLVPDCIRAFSAGQTVRLRNPNAIRPWQHVLEPLCGYLTLAERLFTGGGEFEGGWNFGPLNEGAKTVQWIVERISSKLGGANQIEIDTADHPDEEACIILDSSKAARFLGFSPTLTIDQALSMTAEWYSQHNSGADMRRVTLNQVETYEQMREESND